MEEIKRLVKQMERDLTNLKKEVDNMNVCWECVERQTETILDALTSEFGDKVRELSKRLYGMFQKDVEIDLSEYFDVDFSDKCQRSFVKNVLNAMGYRVRINSDGKAIIQVDIADADVYLPKEE